MREKKPAPTGGQAGQGALTSKADFNIQQNPNKRNYGTAPDVAKSTAAFQIGNILHNIGGRHE